MFKYIFEAQLYHHEILISELSYCKVKIVIEIADNKKSTALRLFSKINGVKSLLLTFDPILYSY